MHYTLQFCLYLQTNYLDPLSDRMFVDRNVNKYYPKMVEI